MSSTHTRGHILPLTSLRFIAAAMIVALHISGKLGLPDFKESFPYGSGVSFFYVLSGFILTYVYYRPGNKLKFFDFVKKRFLRLYPLHIATLILMCILVPAVLKDLVHLPAQLTLTQSWFGSKAAAYSFNAPAWSISTEMGFYLLFPFFLLLYKRIGAVFVFLTAATILGLIFMNQAAPNLAWFWSTVDVHPISRLVEFICGIWVAKLFLNHSDIKGSALTFTLFEALSILLIVVLGFMITNIYNTSLYPVIGNNLYSFLARSGLFIFFAFLILVFSYSRGAISKLLCWRPFVFLGEISFAVYLVHQIIIVALIDRPELTLGAPWPIILLGVLGITLAISTLLHLIIEKPFIKLSWKNIGEVIKRSGQAIKTRATALNLGLLSASLILPMLFVTGVYPSKVKGFGNLGQNSFRANLKAVSNDVTLKSYKFEESQGRILCISLLWEFSAETPNKNIYSTTRILTEGKVTSRRRKALLVPKRIKPSQYPIQVIDNSCHRRNHDKLDIILDIKPEGEGAIRFPYRKNVRSSILFRKNNRIILMNTKK